MSAAPVRLALTPGEPAGVGPDLVTAIAGQPSAAERVVIGDADVLAERAAVLGHPWQPYPIDPAAAPRGQRPGEVAIHAIAGPDTTLEPDENYVVAVEPGLEDEVRRLFRG